MHRNGTTPGGGALARVAGGGVRGARAAASFSPALTAYSSLLLLSSVLRPPCPRSVRSLVYLERLFSARNPQSRDGDGRRDAAWVLIALIAGYRGGVISLDVINLHNNIYMYIEVLLLVEVLVEVLLLVRSNSDQRFVSGFAFRK